MIKAAIKLLPTKWPTIAISDGIERKERHIGSDVTAMRDVEIVNGVPARPDRKERIRRFRNVRARPLRDRDRG
ncbi:MAG: hypothetical protein IAI50_18220 [Candidatus Eremiobacteraeota bacterium]|nr:hypothetical protein [Candidatus Eremiobacteraeota bacterium]